MTPSIISQPMRDYLALKALSGGLVNTLLEFSPEHARLEQQGKSQDSSNDADVGTAIHDCFLEGIDRIEAIEPAKYPSQNGAIPKGWTNNAIREARDKARAAGKIPLLADKVSQVKAAVESLVAFIPKTEIAGFKTDGKPEQTITWTDNGVFCKARPDWLSRKWHVSLKTTDGSANPLSWVKRQLSPMGYDTSLMFYERGLKFHGLTAQPRILVVEQNPPYGCSVIGLAPSKREYAERLVEEAIQTWAECERTGRWPGYPTETFFAEIQGYELAEIESRL